MIAEYYAQAEFMSYGYEVYDTTIDDRGIDFVARRGDELLEVQVKAVRNNNYTFIAESKMPKPLTDSRIVCYFRFTDGSMPDMYIIPSTVWNTTNSVFTYKDYKDKKSKPEYGISGAKSGLELLEPYRAEHYFEREAAQGLD